MMFPILAGKVILVVDDDAANRQAILSALSMLAPETAVLSAATGRQALRVLASSAVDLVLLDWEMPELDGYATLLEIKANENLKNLPVVMYTGIMTSVEALQRALAAGAADFLRKPTDALEIAARLQAILRQREYQQQAIVAERERLQAQLMEMSAATLHLQEQETLMDSLREGLRQSLTEINPKETIKKLLRSLPQQDLTDENWERYRKRLDAMQGGFLERLAKLHPDLTRQQLTLASLFRMGFVSKEVAQTLGMSLDALDKSRYRLRKKLPLQPSDSLESFLLGI